MNNPSVHPSIRLSICPSMHLSVHPSVHPSILLFVRPSVHPYIYSSVHPSTQTMMQTPSVSEVWDVVKIQCDNPLSEAQWLMYLSQSRGNTLCCFLLYTQVQIKRICGSKGTQFCLHQNPVLLPALTSQVSAVGKRVWRPLVAQLGPMSLRHRCSLSRFYTRELWVVTVRMRMKWAFFIRRDRVRSSHIYWFALSGVERPLWRSNWVITRGHWRDSITHQVKDTDAGERDIWTTSPYWSDATVTCTQISGRTDGCIWM